jgi:hypothetical protein
MTDLEPPDAFRRIASGRAAFRTVDLLEMRVLLDQIATRMERDNA